MTLRLHFLGAAGNVTGSSYCVELDGKRLLVDCGLYQERKLRKRNWDPFPVPAADIDAVLLTHAHLDHCGLLPKLVKEGYRGPVYATPATADIAAIVLRDSGKIQQEDAEHKRRRHEREGRKGPYPDVPLYTVEDAEAAVRLLQPVPYGEALGPLEGVEATFHDAGHILGSSMVFLRVRRNGEERTLLFSGDLGRCDLPILRDPTTFDSADYVVVESTYGDRLHRPTASIPGSLSKIVNRTHKLGGNVVVPSFAVERTQELLYHLSGLLAEKRIPPLTVFVDSPMAIRVTEVFRRHPELFDEHARALLREGRHPCDFPGLVLCRTVEESKAIKHHEGTAIIIAGSGMCTGGRIKHHLVSNISRPESVVLFVGYQASGTLGRLILEGLETVRIHGEHYPVEASVAKINGFSAHADRRELFRWLSALSRPPRRIFVTHGEPESSDHFATYVRGKTGWETRVPAYGDSVALD